MPRSKRKTRRKRQPALPTGEDRRAEAVTVAWMLTTLSTFVAEAGAIVFRLLQLSGGEVASPELGMLSQLLLFIALVTGVFCLVLTAATHRLRRVAPPREIMVFATLVGLAPWITIAAMAIAS